MEPPPSSVAPPVDAAPGLDAPPGELPLEGGSYKVTACGYDVRTPAGASAPIPGDAHLGSDPTPFQIHLGVAGPAPTSMAITWRTRDNTTRASKVRYGKASASSTENGLTWEYLPGFSSSGPRVRIHEAHLCGLEPDTTYKYQVGGVGADGKESWSPEYTFRTAPDLTADPAAEVVLLVLGDTRDGYDSWGKILNLAQAKVAPDLIAFSGDAVTFGQLQEEWDAFFEAGANVLTSVPILSAHGNHDTHAVNFFSQLAMPRDELNFSLDYGAAHLTVLNDSPVEATMIQGQIRDFLQSDLAANAQKPWKLVMNHRAFWSSAANHGGDPALVAAWGPLIDQHHVDVVLNGHDHNYERSFPIFGSEIKSSAAEGTYYVVAGSAGADLYESGSNAWTAKVEKTHNFGVLTIRKGQLDWKAYRDDGSLLDEFTITK